MIMAKLMIKINASLAHLNILLFIHL